MIDVLYHCLVMSNVPFCHVVYSTLFSLAHCCRGFGCHSSRRSTARSNKTSFRFPTASVKTLRLSVSGEKPAGRSWSWRHQALGLPWHTERSLMCHFLWLWSRIVPSTRSVIINVCSLRIRIKSPKYLRCNVNRTLLRN